MLHVVHQLCLNRLPQQPLEGGRPSSLALVVGSAHLPGGCSAAGRGIGMRPEAEGHGIWGFYLRGSAQGSTPRCMLVGQDEASCCVTRCQAGYTLQHRLAHAGFVAGNVGPTQARSARGSTDSHI